MYDNLHCIICTELTTSQNVAAVLSSSVIDNLGLIMGEGV